MAPPPTTAKLFEQAAEELRGADLVVKFASGYLPPEDGSALGPMYEGLDVYHIFQDPADTSEQPVASLRYVRQEPHGNRAWTGLGPVPDVLRAVVALDTAVGHFYNQQSSVRRNRLEQSHYTAYLPRLFDHLVEQELNRQQAPRPPMRPGPGRPTRQHPQAQPPISRPQPAPMNARSTAPAEPTAPADAPQNAEQQLAPMQMPHIGDGPAERRQPSAPAAPQRQRWGFVRITAAIAKRWRNAPRLSGSLADTRIA